MRFYIVVIFGVLLQFISLFLLKIFSLLPLPQIPDLIVILAVYLIVYEENMHFVLFCCWILGLLKDGMSVEYFGVYSIIFSIITFLLLRLKLFIDLTSTIIMSLLVLFFTLQYSIIHSMIIFVAWDVDLAKTAVTSAFCTAIFTPLIVPILNLFNEKRSEDL